MSSVFCVCLCLGGEGGKPVLFQVGIFGQMGRLVGLVGCSTISWGHVWPVNVATSYQMVATSHQLECKIWSFFARCLSWIKAASSFCTMDSCCASNSQYGSSLDSRSLNCFKRPSLQKVGKLWTFFKQGGRPSFGGFLIFTQPGHTWTNVGSYILPFLMHFCIFQHFSHLELIG